MASTDFERKRRASWLARLGALSFAAGLVAACAAPGQPAAASAPAADMPTRTLRRLRPDVVVSTSSSSAASERGVDSGCECEFRVMAPHATTTNGTVARGSGLLIRAPRERSSTTMAGPAEADPAVRCRVRERQVRSRQRATSPST